MSVPLIQIIRNINQICFTSSYQSQFRQNSSRFNRNKSQTKRYPEEEVLMDELESLKTNVFNLTKYCQSLQNQNKVLKRIVTKSNQSFSSYSYGKSSFFNESIRNQTQQNQYPRNVQDSNYFTRIQSQIQNSQKIEVVKNELVGLTDNLKQLSKIYEAYDLDSTNENQSKDNFVNQCSLNVMDKTDDSSVKKVSEDVDLEYLLCHEQLSFDDSELKNKTDDNGSTDKIVIDSLIAKGIEYRESRTLRSKEFENLSKIIQQYRNKFCTSKVNPQSKQSSTLKYR